MMRTRKLLALAVIALLPMAGCIGLFGDDDEGDEEEAAAFGEEIGEETAAQIEGELQRQFTNYTIPGQEELDRVVLWLNGTVGPGESIASQEDRNDRSGNNYNTEIISEDISEHIPPGQPAEIELKLWFFGQPGSSAQIDTYVNVPGIETEWSGDDCDEFSWKICVQERTLSTIGVDGEPAEVGVQISNNRALIEDLDYFYQVRITYADNVIAPYAPFAVNVPENATGLVFSSVKPNAGHLTGEFIVIDPDDQLVDHVEYNDLALATESRLVNIDQPGEYIVYAQELTGGFLAVDSDVPVPPEQLEARMLDTVTEDVVIANNPSPGAGCVPVNPEGAVGDCDDQPMFAEDTAQFNVEGTFPLELHAWINDEGSPDANADTEVRIHSDSGMVYHAKKWAQYEDERGTLGSTRDDLNFNAYWENLALGSHTVEYVASGTGEIGYTLITYER